MNVEELTKYLSEFPKSSKISMIITNPSKDVRKIYPIKEFHTMRKDKDNDMPCFIVEVGNPKPLDGYVSVEN